MSTTAEAPAEHGRPARDGGRPAGPTPGQRRRRKTRRNLVVTLVLAAVLLAVMIAVTPFKTAEQVRALNPPAFSADTYVAEGFPKITAGITDRATPIATLAPAVDADVAAAGAEYGVDGGGTFTFPVSATGTVASVDANFAVLQVEGVPEGDVVRIPLGAALNGTPVRDAAGLAFGDFPGQTEFQNVANELKIAMTTKVLEPADLAGRQGQEVSVVGVYATGGPPNSFIVQPVSIEAGP